MTTCPEARERHEELATAYRLRCRLDGLPAEQEGFGMLDQADDAS